VANLTNLLSLQASTEAIAQLHALSQGLHKRLARLHNGQGVGVM